MSNFVFLKRPFTLSKLKILEFDNGGSQILTNRGKGKTSVPHQCRNISCKKEGRKGAAKNSCPPIGAAKSRILPDFGKGASQILKYFIAVMS